MKFWNSNKSHILKDFTLIDKLYFWKKYIFNKFNKVFLNYINYLTEKRIVSNGFNDERKNLVIPEGSLAHSRYMLELDKYQELSDEADAISERFKNVDLEYNLFS